MTPTTTTPTLPLEAVRALCHISDRHPNDLVPGAAINSELPEIVAAVAGALRDCRIIRIGAAFYVAVDDQRKPLEQHIFQQVRHQPIGPSGRPLERVCGESGAPWAAVGSVVGVILAAAERRAALVGELEAIDRLGLPALDVSR